MGLETDRKTLEALIEKTRVALTFLRNANFAAPGFSWTELEVLDRFVAESKGAEYEFINQELEILQKLFLKDSRDFLEILAPTIWKYESQKITGSVDRIHNAADKLCASYDQLIRTANTRLAR